MKVYAWNARDNFRDWAPEVLRNNRIANALRVVMAVGDLPEHKVLAIANSLQGVRQVDWHPFRVHTRHEIFFDASLYKAALRKAVTQKRRRPHKKAFEILHARSSFHTETVETNPRATIYGLNFVCRSCGAHHATWAARCGRCRGFGLLDQSSVTMVCYNGVPLAQYVRHLTGDQLARGLGELERHVDYIHRVDTGRRRQDIEARMVERGGLAAKEAAQLTELVNEAADMWMEAVGVEVRRRKNGAGPDVCTKSHRRVWAAISTGASSV